MERPQEDTVALHRTVRFVELYSGVGGWTMALKEQIDTAADCNLQCVAALDHSDLCRQVYNHNHGCSHTSFRNAKALCIEKLTLAQVEAWDASIWLLSPPCQPHSRQHSRASRDEGDPRSASFWHLCELLKQMNANKKPALLCLENVVGFEISKSCRRVWMQALHPDYLVAEFHLTPTQVGLPNDRPRYYCLAVLKAKLKGTAGADDALRGTYLKKAISSCCEQPNAPGGIILHTSIPELNVRAEGATNLPPIAYFLDDALADTSALQVPSKLLERSASWCFDIVTPSCTRSSCFTSSYAKFVKGTGSILYMGKEEVATTGRTLVAENMAKEDFAGTTTKTCKMIGVLQDPADRVYQSDWTTRLDVSKLRYFSGLELGRLFGFPASFTFPNDTTVKQQWKLMGNSLNVQVATKIIELGLEFVNVK
jgi:tRNA (cytosine38-C5)-methyltransferase